jgi:hypothetical protein
VTDELLKGLGRTRRARLSVHLATNRFLLTDLLKHRGAQKVPQIFTMDRRDCFPCWDEFWGTFEEFVNCHSPAIVQRIHNLTVSLAGEI